MLRFDASFRFSAPSWSKAWAFVAALLVTAPTSAQVLELTSRHVMLQGNIDFKGVENVVARLLEFDQRSQDPVFLRINSPGGSVEAGYVLIDVMNAMKSPVHCVVESKAHSMAAMLTTYCDRVFILPHATMMFHEASYGTLGEDPAIRSKVEFNSKYLQRVYEEVAQRLEMDAEEYRRRIRDGWWLLAEEAVDAGAADEVVYEIRYREVFVEELEIKRTVKTVRRSEPAFANGAEVPSGAAATSE